MSDREEEGSEEWRKGKEGVEEGKADEGNGDEEEDVFDGRRQRRGKKKERSLIFFCSSPLVFYWLMVGIV